MREALRPVQPSPAVADQPPRRLAPATQPPPSASPVPSLPASEQEQDPEASETGSEAELEGNSDGSGVWISLKRRPEEQKI